MVNGANLARFRTICTWLDPAWKNVVWLDIAESSTCNSLSWCMGLATRSDLWYFFSTAGFISGPLAYWWIFLSFRPLGVGHVEDVVMWDLEGRVRGCHAWSPGAWRGSPAYWDWGPQHADYTLYPKLNQVKSYISSSLVQYIMYGFDFHTPPLQDLEKELLQIEAVTATGLTGKIARVSVAIPAIASVRTMYPFLGCILS